MATALKGQPQMQQYMLTSSAVPIAAGSFSRIAPTGDGGRHGRQAGGFQRAFLGTGRPLRGLSRVSA